MVFQPDDGGGEAEDSGRRRGDEGVEGGETAEDAMVFLEPVGLEVGDEKVDMAAEMGGGEEKGDDDVVYVVKEVSGEAASGEEESG